MSAAAAPASALLERLVPGLDAADAADAPAPRWLREHGLPTVRDEAWRSSPLDRILAGDWQAGPAVSAELDAAGVDALVGAVGAPRLVFVDGVLARGLSDAAALPSGVRYGSGPAPVRPARYDAFQAAAEAAHPDAGVLHVAPSPAADAEAVVHVVHLTTGGVSHARTVVALDPGAHLTLIESHAGTAAGSLTNAATVCSVGAGARLTHHRLVTGPVGAAHVGHTAATVDEGAELRSWSFLAGVDTARTALDVVLRGEGAQVDLAGLDLPVGDQEHDTVVTVEHAASHGTSRQHFRGVVDGRARTSFGGRIVVAHGTVGTDAGQTSRSLLLQPTARADARPWLEIFADDVRCSHGATVGRLDEDALFFLRSRGIPRDTARRMLVEAFASELLDPLDRPALRAFVQASVAGVLAGEAVS